MRRPMAHWQARINGESRHDMTTRELIHWAGQHPVGLLLAFGVPPLLAWLAGRVQGAGQGRCAPWKYLYAVLVYVVSVPGMFAGVITAYTFFVSGENLLDADLLVYFLPLASMLATLVLIRQRVSFDDVPGFDRLSGLLVMVASSFALALGIQKTRIFVFFGGSVTQLFMLAAILFGLFKWGVSLFFRRRNEPAPKRPPLPGL
jgi:hypothetical protein